MPMRPLVQRMCSVRNQTHTLRPPTRTRPWKSWALGLALLLTTLTTSVSASIFGVSTVRLSYDIVSVKNNPTNINNLDLMMTGSDLPVATIARTVSVPSNGFTVSPNVFTFQLTHFSVRSYCCSSFERFRGLIVLSQIMSFDF